MAQVNPAKPKPKPVNEGQRQLRASGLSLKQIGDAAGVSKPAAGEWLSGKSKPSGERLERLVASGFVSDAGAFERAPGAPRHGVASARAAVDQPAAGSPTVPDWMPGAAEAALTPPPLPPREPEPAPPPPPAEYGHRVDALDAPGAARALVMAQLKRLQADTARLRLGKASDAEIRKAEASETALAMQLAKLAGELNPTEEQRLVKSVRWHVIKAAVFKALTPWPDALKAALDAVEAAEVT
jgi:transcriptional regulator with XRE-family HTH domain